MAMAAKPIVTRNHASFGRHELMVKWPRKQPDQRPGRVLSCLHPKKPNLKGTRTTRPRQSVAELSHKAFIFSRGLSTEHLPFVSTRTLTQE